MKRLFRGALSFREIVYVNVRHRVPQQGACDFLVKPFSFRSFSNSKLMSNLNFNIISPLDLDRLFLIVEFYEHST